MVMCAAVQACSQDFLQGRGHRQTDKRTEQLKPRHTTLQTSKCLAEKVNCSNEHCSTGCARCVTLTFPASSIASLSFFLFPVIIFICTKPPMTMKGPNPRSSSVSSHEYTKPIVRPHTMADSDCSMIPSRTPATCTHTPWLTVTAA